MKQWMMAAVLASLCTMTPAHVWAQLQSATLGGTVSDATGALIPGVEITATNDGTGIATRVITNETGSYSFTLQPGTYTVSASLASFQTRTYSDVTLGTTQRLRLNFTLQVAGAAQEVEVTASAADLLAETSSTVGDVLPEQTVQSLPTVGNNILSLLETMSGVRMNDDGVNGSFAGLSTRYVNVQRDGIDASASARWQQAGMQTSTLMNPDLVGELRVIIAPVDAELGRGNGMFLVTTRSGTNQYRGSAVWSVRNSALDANTWNNNNDVDSLTGQWSPTPADWINRNQYTLSYGGPIVEDRTFFFALWDHQIVRNRDTQNTLVLTPCARNGVFRFFDGWNNGNTQQSTTGGFLPTTQVVDATGRPALLIDGVEDTAAQVRYASVFGQLAADPQQPDCSDAEVVPGTAWDTYRTQMDPTGFVETFLDPDVGQPLPNNYEVGDGLNVAGHRWVRHEKGGQNVFGFGGDGIGRKQINFKVDHNFSESHKLAVTYTYEDATGTYNPMSWPGTFEGTQFTHPQHLAVNFTSTLSPNLLNEVKVGSRRTGLNSYSAFENPDTGLQAQSFYPNIGGFPVYIGPGDGAMGFGGQGWNAGGTTSTYLDSTVLWSFGDTMSWVKGAHAFKFGGEMRRGWSDGYDAGIGTTAIPRANGGNTPLVGLPQISSADVPGLAGTNTLGNRDRMQHMLNLLSGSLASLSQYFWMQEADQLDAFENYTTFPNRNRKLHLNEFNWFFKDDWKATPDLTLNLGVRWDYYGAMYDAGGMMPAAVGTNYRAWGMSWDGTGSPFDTWMVPGDRGEDMAIEFVGKGSPNPDRAWHENDWNNFAPAVGFAWQIPWLGAGRTTLRGGYQISYQQITDSYNDVFQETNWPGMTYTASYQGDSTNPYLDLTDLAGIVPAPVPIDPMQPLPRTAHSAQIYAADPALTAPYVQNLTLTLARSIGRSMTIEAQYIGALARKQHNAQFNINVPNFLHNGLKEAFDAVRYGNDLSPEAAVLERMFEDVNVAGAGYGPVGSTFDGVLQTAGLHLRNDSRFSSDLANGDYAGLAGTLATLNYDSAFNPTLPVLPFDVFGGVLLHANTLHPGEFPENFIVANPQLGNIHWTTNNGSNNYHALNIRFTLRPTAGVSTQTTLTWSKNHGYGEPANLGTVWTDPTNRRLDYNLLPDTRVVDLRSHGTFALPMGPNQVLFGNSSGTLARIVEGWQMSWIVSMNTGQPVSISTFTGGGFGGGTGTNHLYGNGVPDAVGPADVIDEFFKQGGKVEFGELANSSNGTYFGAPGTDFQVVEDPQCAGIHPSIRNACSLNAIADSNGEVLLQNPYPGTRGTLGMRSGVFGPGRWRFDASVSKEVQIDESRSLQFRMDAQNVLNHPEPNAPVFNINDGDFGIVEGKNDQHRQFQAEVRFNF